MQLSDDLLTVFTAEIESGNRGAVVSVPDRELAIGDLERGGRYRVAILPPTDGASDGDAEGGVERRSGRAENRPQHGAGPPVDEGEKLDVEIEDVGDQGDGIARIGPGYIVFVPSTEVGDRVTIAITEARENFAFAEVVEPEPVSG
ncbi:MAG: TRAM domain-containing protein [Halobacteriales archaeon]